MSADTLLAPVTHHDSDMSLPASYESSEGLVALYSARSPEKTTANEDSAAVVPFGSKSIVLAVADGVGGGAQGEMASKEAICAIHDAIAAAAPHDLARTLILNGFEEANRRVRAMGVGAATTLAVVEITSGEARPYHVGDSMILVVGGRGKVKLQTLSHSPVGYAVEAGYLDEKEALHHEDRHLVSNVVGQANMRIEIGQALKLAPRDTLVLASDGLEDNLRIEEIIERCRKGPLVDAVTRLAVDAGNRMVAPRAGDPSKADDLTMVLYRRKSLPRKRTKKSQQKPASQAELLRSGAGSAGSASPALLAAGRQQSPPREGLPGESAPHNSGASD